MHVAGRRGGFSLIEATVAVSLLAVTCVAVSGVLNTALHAERSLERRRHLEAVLAAEAERLAALPYYLEAQGSGWPAAPSSLVGDVFPHASTSLNVPEARFGDGSDATPAGTFASEVRADGLTVKRLSRFVTITPAGVAPVALHALTSWAVWSTALPPSGLVEVDLQTTWQGLVVERHLVLGASEPSFAGPVAVACGGPRVS
jgi:type II secretory pathway pseudopilin PulG